ncbi:MAG: aldehyde dehydrogenase family protein [Bryobacteraceae bacterium]
MTIVEQARQQMPAAKLFVDGAYRDSTGRDTLEIRNPANGELLARVPDATPEDVDQAVRAARESFEAQTWRGLDPSAKERILLRFADLIEHHKDSLAALESLENGKTLREALSGDVQPAIDAIRYYAGWVRRIYGETIPVDGPFLNYTLREPVGVVGAIIPWNYPTCLAAWKLGPALACGCSVVLKPSELTPLTALKLAEYAAEAGLPPGVLNVVTGQGQSAGEALSRHPDVDKISFTGSIRTARAILKAAAETNLKRVSLELGGKSPNIVFADADRAAALKAALWGIFANKGEVCSAGSRLLVQADIHDEVVAVLAERASKLRVGDPLDPVTEMGAQISARQLERILDYVRSGVDQGARLVCGGERDTDGDKSRGYFVKPTIFANVRPDMRIAQEEIFGPVLAVLPFRDPDEAIAIANGTIYGLVAAVWTRDIALAHRMAREIRAGAVWINTYNAFDSGSPFGGYKQSGFGRDLGAYALEQYTNVKSVWVSLQ